MMPQQPVQQPIQQPVQQPQNDSKNLGLANLTIAQIGGSIVVVGSIVMSAFSAWSNLNKELDAQKATFAQHVELSKRDNDDLNEKIHELKASTAESKLQTQKQFELLDKHIQDLDSTVTNMYQKMMTSKRM
jgi:hypothetical protein